MKKLKFPLLVFALIVFALAFQQCTSSEDDTPPIVENVNISISDASADEGGDYTTISVQLTLDAAAASEITANISTADGTAEGNEDFIALNNEPVVFAAGETSKTIEVYIIGDKFIEEDEQFEVTISSVSGPAIITDGTATIGISNDDTEIITEVVVAPTVDWDQLATSTPGSELPYDVFNFGQPSGVPNAEFTSLVALGDTIWWPAKFSPAGDTILYYEIEFEDPVINDGDYLLSDDSLQIVVDGDYWLEVGAVVAETPPNGDFGKYTWTIYLGTATGRLGPFLVDPKIRIPN